MRLALVALICAIACTSCGPARADQYRWCANYGKTEGSLNCYFVTLQQCEAALSGIGGFCMPSPFVSTPTQANQAQRKKKQS